MYQGPFCTSLYKQGYIDPMLAQFNTKTGWLSYRNSPSWGVGCPQSPSQDLRAPLYRMKGLAEMTYGPFHL